MSWTTCSSGHDSTGDVSLKTKVEKLILQNNNGDEEAGQDEEDADLIEIWHGSVGAADKCSCNDCGNNVGDKDMPGFRSEVWMFESPHLNDSV